MGETDEFLVKGLADQAKSLKLPDAMVNHINSMLDVIIKINGSTVPEDIRHKQILLGQVTNTIGLGQFTRDIQAAHVAGCIVSQRIRRDDVTGRLIMPWEPDIEKAMIDGAKTQKITVPGEEPAKEEGSGVEYSYPGLGKLRIYGKAAGKAVGIAAVICYMGYSIYRDRQFEKRVETRLAGVSQDQAHNRVSATTQRSRIREDVKILRDEGDAGREAPYEPAPN